MSQSRKNYYDLLGLSAAADMDSVRTAYRRLARENHPDLHPGDRAKEERFKAINEAYDFLSNPDKKATYDAALKAGRSSDNAQKAATARQKAASAKAEPPKTQPPPKQKPQATGHKATASGAGPQQKDTVSSINDLFDSFLKKGFNFEAQPSGGPTPKPPPGNRTAPKSPPKRGQDVTVEAALTQGEAEEGIVKTVNVQHQEACKACSATGRVNGKVCSACNGEKRQIKLKKIDVRIPPGVREGSRVRVAGEGGKGSDGGEAGDLYLQIKVTVDAGLRVDGLDVYSELSVPVTTAVLGSPVAVPTLNGSVTMTIPAGTSSGQVFRLRNQGAKGGNSQGDHYVTIRITVPETLSTRERELYEELARLRKS
ncbi:MAG: DnaJ C-terminal domain-containing protein [Candidatus Melainabacteria bacterium]